MKEIHDIIRAFEAATTSGKKTALATVVEVEGSSYRREGARMLITDDGQLTGAISGGCLEGDALRKALLVMSQQSPMLVTYDTADEDDAKLGLGLGCNGVIRILIEPIDGWAKVNALSLLKEAVATREPSVLATMFSLDKHVAGSATCLLVKKNSMHYNTSGREGLPSGIVKDAKAALEDGTSTINSYGAYTAFLSVIKPAVSLVVFGAGNDAIPLVQMAQVLGWCVTVVDGRPAYATKARFPQAKEVIVGKPEAALRKLVMDQHTAVVLMTHNYTYDLSALSCLMPLDLPYIGVLGPKKKLERMLDELADKGSQCGRDERAHVYGPTGLDIGASTPEEIALSILAEVQAVMSKRDGIALRERTLPIHA